jgi:hypothetical protein
MATKLTCGDTHISATALAIYRPTLIPEFVELLDVSNPLKPTLACTLSPVSGVRILSATKLAFWTGNELGRADLTSGAITPTARLAARADSGAFSRDGSKFAYRHYDDVSGMSLHLYVAGSDQSLYTQEPLGGHGGPGPSFGPIDQLEFSPDGTLLLDFNIFRPQSGPAGLAVFKSDGSILFQSTTATGGAWSPTSNTLFFSSIGVPGATRELYRFANAQLNVVASGLPGLFWLRMSPDGSSIIYNASDTSVLDCGGVPHLWSLNLTTARTAQLSTLVSSGPIFFVQPTVVWSEELQLTQCGPGGPTIEAGVILAHDLRTGAYQAVDMTTVAPVPTGAQAPFASTVNLLDTWFAPA